MLKGYMVGESLGTLVITQQFLLWGAGIAHVSPSCGQSYPLYDAIHEKIRLHKRATHASAQSSPKAQVYRIGVPNLSLTMYPLLNFL